MTRVLRDTSQKAGLAAPSPVGFLDRLRVSLSSAQSACLETGESKQLPWQIPNLVTPRRSVPLALSGEGFEKTLGCVMLLALHLLCTKAVIM